MKSKAERDALFAKFDAAIARVMKQHDSCEFTLDWELVVAVVGHLQLALRHPANTGPSPEAVREFLDAFLAKIESLDPTLAAIMALGDEPEYDC